MDIVQFRDLINEFPQISLIVRITLGNAPQRVAARDRHGLISGPADADRVYIHLKTKTN